MKKIVNKRVEAIDLARGVGVFFIPMAHALLIYGSSYTQEESWLGLVVHFFGKWAGVFLIAMGFSYTLSRNNSIKNSFRRGVILLLLGYLMNFLKFIIPLFGGVIYLLGCNLLALYLASILTKNAKNNKIKNFFFYCSRKITSIYIVQWILICWSMGAIGYHDKGIRASLLLMTLFTLGTFLGQKVIDLIRNKGKGLLVKYLKEY